MELKQEACFMVSQFNQMCDKFQNLENMRLDK